MLPSRQIHSDVTPRRLIKQRSVGTIDVLAAQIEDDERFVEARLKIIAAEHRHLVERARVHRGTVNRWRDSLATSFQASP